MPAASHTPLPAGPATTRRIIALAIPALGSLVAEPLYLLVDTAIVGHLGRQQLAALGLASQALITIAGLCVFLAYGTTTAVARAQSAREQAAVGVQGAWLAACVGITVAAILIAAAGPIMRALGGDTETAALAARYVQLSAPGLAAQLLVLAGQGWLRGREQLGLALRLIVAAQLINVVLELWLVYGLDLGLDGSALGTVVAQVWLAATTLWLLSRQCQQTGASRRPVPAQMRAMANFGGLLFARSLALIGSYLLLASLAARISDAAVAAHQIAIQLLWLGALALDALAIAAQLLISAAFGAGAMAQARRTSLHVVGLSMAFAALLSAALLVIGAGRMVSLFGDDPLVARAAAELWPWLCAAQLIGGLVFALDGILIGAQDGQMLALGMVASAAVMLAALLALDTGDLGQLWVALVVLLLARAATLSVRSLRGPLQRIPAASR